MNGEMRPTRSRAWTHLVRAGAGLVLFVASHAFNGSGNDTALFNSGISYLNGDGVTKDEMQAAELVKRAAGHGFAPAQNVLGLLYIQGRGVPKNESLAVVWCRKAADQGNASAQSNLGLLYEQGHGVPKDETQAAAWYLKAATQGNAVAQSNLGTLYDQGRGVPKDEARAAVWYRRAADQGSAPAQNNLGFLYQRGSGVPKDDAQAQVWYQRAADQGDALAQTNLKILRAQGREAAKDLAQPVVWHEGIARRGGLAAANAGGPDVAPTAVSVFEKSCVAPTQPAVALDGATATREQMLAAHLSVHAYDVATMSYLECLGSVYNRMSHQKSGAADQSDLHAVAALRVMMHNNAVEADKALADEFNVQLNVFKARPGLQ